MKIVYNIPRYAAKDGKIPYNGGFILPLQEDKSFADKAVWISISEPDDQRTIISGPFDQLPTIKLAFWDLIRSVEYKGQILRPPPEKDARKIVDFLTKYRDRQFVIVNCAAGVSRSGAVAQFCNDFFGYEWEPFCKSCAVPNSVLYRLMVEYYQQKRLTNNE